MIWSDHFFHDCFLAAMAKWRPKSVDALVIPSHLKHIVDECVKSNVILKLPAARAEMQFDITLVVLYFCQRCIAAAAVGQKACILVPTVDKITHLFLEAKRVLGMRVFYVVGSSRVDVWKRKDWQEFVQQHDIFVVAPQVFLDALYFEYIRLEQFCALVFDDCQHCIGSHACSKILRWYFAAVQESDSIRVLGVGTHLVKRKIKDDVERRAAVKRLEKALHAQGRDVDVLMANNAAEMASGQRSLRCAPPPPPLDLEVADASVESLDNCAGFITNVTSFTSEVGRYKKTGLHRVCIGTLERIWVGYRSPSYRSKC